VLPKPFSVGELLERIGSGPRLEAEASPPPL
jgi:hypothetical protein